MTIVPFFRNDDKAKEGLVTTRGLNLKELSLKQHFEANAAVVVVVLWGSIDFSVLRVGKLQETKLGLANTTTIINVHMDKDIHKIKSSVTDSFIPLSFFFSFLHCYTFPIHYRSHFLQVPF